MFRFFAHHFGEHYLRVFLFFSLCISLIVLYLLFFPPEVESNVLSLLPQKDPVVKDFVETLRDFKSIDHLFIHIKTRDDEDPIENYLDTVDEYVRLLKESGYVLSVEYRLQDFQESLKVLYPYIFLYLEENELEKIKEAFTTEAIFKSMSRNKNALFSPSSFIEKELIKIDPLNLLPQLKSHFIGKSRKINVDFSTGYYISKDYKNSLLIIVRPKEPSQNIVFVKKLFEALKKIENDLKRNDREAQSLDFLYGGGYAINYSDSSLVIKDALINTTTSFVLVLLITFIAFKARSALVYGWLPLLSALLCTFFLLTIFSKKFNAATGCIGALLIGLGIDFSTLLYGRFLNERKRGQDIEISIETTMVHTLKSILTGALTTIATFIVMIIAPFKGMRQIGIFVSIGILLVLLLNMILFPPMVKFHYHYKKKRGKEQKFQINCFGFEKIAKIAYANPILTVIVSIGLVIVFFVFSLRVSHDDSVQALRSGKNEGLLNTREINQKFGASFTNMMVVVKGKDPFEISTKTKRVVKALEPLRNDQRILYTDSISTYLPDLEAQKKVISFLKKERFKGLDYERIKRDFIKACNKEGLNPDYFKDFLETLEKALNPTILTYEKILETPFSIYLENFIVKKGSEQFKGVVYVYISEKYKREEPPFLLETVKNVEPDSVVVGMNLLSKTIRPQLKKSALETFLIGTLFVFLIIYLDFRSIKMVWLSLSPLFFSIVMLFGTMYILQEPINMMNIFVTTMIIGITSDYGIHIVHRFLQKDGRNIEKIIDETIKPVIVAALTTMAGFGSLYFSSFPGLKSVGLVAFMGTLYGMLASLTFLIAMLAIHIKREK